MITRRKYPKNTHGLRSPFSAFCHRIPYWTTNEISNEKIIYFDSFRNTIDQEEMESTHLIQNNCNIISGLELYLLKSKLLLSIIAGDDVLWGKKDAKLSTSAGQRRQIKTIATMDDIHVSNFDFFSASCLH